MSSDKAIFDVKYQVYKKDRYGNITDELVEKVHTKTLYNPNKISDAEIYTGGLKALENGRKITFDNNKRAIVEGTYNNIKYIGYLDESQTLITNFHPVLNP